MRARDLAFAHDEFDSESRLTVGGWDVVDDSLLSLSEADAMQSTKGIVFPAAAMRDVTLR